MGNDTSNRGRDKSTSSSSGPAKAKPTFRIDRGIQKVGYKPSFGEKSGKN